MRLSSIALHLETKELLFKQCSLSIHYLNKGKKHSNKSQVRVCQEERYSFISAIVHDSTMPKKQKLSLLCKLLGSLFVDEHNAWMSLSLIDILRDKSAESDKNYVF